MSKILIKGVEFNIIPQEDCLRISNTDGKVFEFKKEETISSIFNFVNKIELSEEAHKFLIFVSGKIPEYKKVEKKLLAMAMKIAIANFYDKIEINCLKEAVEKLK